MPADQTPFLCLQAATSPTSAASEPRGAILLEDALPFVRDRELLTLRWAPRNTPRRQDSLRVQWDPRIREPSSTHVPAVDGEQAPGAADTIWKGPEARAQHASRVLERERGSSGAPPKDERHPLSPPPSSPPSSPGEAGRQEVDALASPTPHRGLRRGALELGSTARGTNDSGAGSPAETGSVGTPTRRGSLLGAWCAKLNPFARGTAEEVAEADRAAAAAGESPTEVPASTESPVPRNSHTPPVLRPGPWHPSYEIMAQILASLREHPCNTHFRMPMDEGFRRASAARSRAVDLFTISERVNARSFSGPEPLVHFRRELSLFWENVRAICGEQSAPGQTAGNLSRFASMLLEELPRRSAGRRHGDIKWDLKRPSMGRPMDRRMPGRKPESRPTAAPAAAPGGDRSPNGDKSLSDGKMPAAENVDKPAEKPAEKPTEKPTEDKPAEPTPAPAAPAPKATPDKPATPTEAPASAPLPKQKATPAREEATAAAEAPASDAGVTDAELASTETPATASPPVTRRRGGKRAAPAAEAAPRAKRTRQPPRRTSAPYATRRSGLL